MAYSDHRPLSPHLQIYKPQITSVLSILHRISGAALAFGMALPVAWLWSAAYHAECYEKISAFAGSRLGVILLIGWTLAFYFHLGNGIRHLFWDAGYGYENKTVTATGVLAVLFALGMTAATWACIFERIAP